MSTMSLLQDVEGHHKPAMLNGLSAEQVLERRAQFGENRLPAEKGVSVWKILLNQLKSPLVYIILVAAGVSLVVGELGDFAIIMAVVVIDVILGFIQEYQAQRTYEALKGFLKPTTTVIRDGQRAEVEVWELVPGDLVMLTAGEKAPGDGELVEVTRLSIDEAILTGESEPVNKISLAQAEENPPEKTVGAQTQVYMGTTVVTGRGILRVTKTGTQTELGQIAASLSEHVEEDTPLQVRLKSFSKILTYIVVAFTLVILLVGLVMGREFFDMLRTSIILAIAAVPEGLLIAVTVILVLGMRKILKRNGLVKKLLAVETLGSVTVICTDKTGTLTEGRMRVHRTDLLDNERAWQTMVLCNNLEGAVDIALWEYAEKQMPGSPQEVFDLSQRLAEEMFTSETKYMITAVTSNLFQGERYYFLKGAPEIVMSMCAMTPELREHLSAQVDEWAGEGMRLLGLAYRAGGILEDYSGYTWVGLLGMEDPVREGVVHATQVAQHAGIRTKMITGDYRRTAEHIACGIGLMKEGDSTLEGGGIARLTDEQLQERVKNVAVFSRIRPRDKFRIVRALQANGEITAMIGDGVNDAPALKRANIGVVVGSATDVAKETADLILLDNNFRTVVAAIEEGRVIFTNIRKVVPYTLSNSFAEVLTIFVAMMLGWPAPLVVAQILWIHLICDGPLDIVLGFEPKEPGIMDEPPLSKDAPVLTRLGLTLIGVISITSALFALLMFGYYFAIHGDAAEGRSLVFASFAVNSIIYIFAYRSMRQPLFRMTPVKRNKPLVWAVLVGLLTVAIAFLVPALREVLGIVPLTLAQWGLIVGVAFTLLLAVEIGKAIDRRFAKTNQVSREKKASTIPDKQIRRALRFAKPVVASQFNGSEAQALLAVMEANYQTLAPEVPSLKSPFNQMTLKIAVDVLAFYRSLLTVLPQPKALELIQPFVNNWMDGQFDRWIARRVYVNHTLHRIYRRWWFSNANRADEPDGQKFEYLPPANNLYYGLNVRRCGMVKFLARMGAPELAPFICRGDFHIQKYLPDGIEFKRTQVIAEGGECCDFRYFATDKVSP